MLEPEVGHEGKNVHGSVMRDILTVVKTALGWRAGGSGTGGPAQEQSQKQKLQLQYPHGNPWHGAVSHGKPKSSTSGFAAVAAAIAAEQYS
jgi:hypothetical protein